jgi:nitroreductase
MDLERKSPIAKIIRERRSIKSGYISKPVAKELVLELLNDAVWAPNHGLREPWRFIYVSSEDKDEFVDDLVQTFPKEIQENKRNYFIQPAVSCLIQNFQLLAWEHKLGVVWKTNPHIYEPKVRELLGVQAGEKIVGFLHMGYFNEVPEPKARKAVEEKFTVYKRN